MFMTAGNATDMAAAEHPPESSNKKPVLVNLANVQPKKVAWLWPGRIPLGKLSVLDGDPGLGKSMVALDIAARVTTFSAMPDEKITDLAGPKGVVLLTYEDDLSDTIRPRLEAAGADLSRVVSLTRVRDTDGTEKLPDLGDLSCIVKAVEQVTASLVIVDPLMASIPGQVDSHKDQHIRRALAPLAKMAEETGVAVLVVRHMSKIEGRNPIYRGGGSIGIIGAARAGLLVALDPDDPGGQRRVLAMSKSNLAVLPPSLVYEIHEVSLCWDSVDASVPRVAWLGTSGRNASELLSQPKSEEEKSDLEEAVDFLQNVLSCGPKPTGEVTQEARKVGISDRTLKRARERLGVKASPDYGTGRGVSRWVLALPQDIEGQSLHTENGPLKKTPKLYDITMEYDKYIEDQSECAEDGLLYRGEADGLTEGAI
jgi:hypothetical protein